MHAYVQCNILHACIRIYYVYRYVIYFVLFNCYNNICIVILLYSTCIVLVCTFFVTIILILYTFSLKYVCLNEDSLYIINVVSVFIHKNDNKATYMPQ